MRRLGPIAVCVAVWMLAAGALDAGPGPVVRTGRFEDLAWIAGTWRGTMSGATIEESWSSAIGPSMLGTFRMVSGDQVKFYEFMAIEKAAEGPVLRIRHFGAGLVAWEDKEGAVSFGLETSRRGFATFVNRTIQPPEKLTYAATGKNGLVVRLEKTKGGKPVVAEFKFTRR